MRKIFLGLLLGIAMASCNQGGIDIQAPIALHPENNRYFIFRAKPTILITSAEHYGAVLNLDFDYILYLDELYSKGLNYTRIFTGSYVEDPGAFNIEKNTLAPKEGRFIAPWSRSNVPGYDNGGNKFDLSQWDPHYFARLKDFVYEAGNRGIVVEVTFFSSLYGDEGWKSSPLNNINNINDVDSVDRFDVHTLNNGNIIQYQENMVRKIVTELNGFDNVIYEIQNEPWADNGVIAGEIRTDDTTLPEWQTRVEIANSRSKDWQQFMATVIANEENRLINEHLIAENISNFKHEITDPDPVFSIYNFHYAHPEAVYLNLQLDRAIGFDESGFAGSEDATYRKQAWNFILAGGALFNNLDYSFTVESPEGKDTQNAPGGGSEALRSQLKVLKDFVHSFNFVKMKPNNNIIVNREEVKARGLALDGKEYAIYVEEGNGKILSLNLPNGNYKAEWIDVVNGNTIETHNINRRGAYSGLNIPMNRGDVALRVKASDNKSL